MHTHLEPPWAVTGQPARARDADAERRFDEIYRDHLHAIAGYALRRSRDAEDAADVVAETFLVAWRRLDEVPGGDDARPWLYGVARLVLSNQRRSGDRRSRLAAKLAHELAILPAATPDPDARAQALAALSQLSDAEREVIMLAAWEGLGPEALGVVLGCSPNAAKTRLHRARRRFEKILEGEHS